MLEDRKKNIYISTNFFLDSRFLMSEDKKNIFFSIRGGESENEIDDIRHMILFHF